jgi:molybdenum cofactor guanylyltransferase
MPIASQHITGLVLAGGQGSRMGGADKGLVLHQGQALSQHALQRLRGQVGSLAVSANRNLSVYAALGVPVWPDDDASFAGPLAGFLVGLQRCTTPYLLTVPCDTPNFPDDLAEKLSAALVRANADMSIACTLEHDRVAPQPLFCCIKTSLAAHLKIYLQNGQRQVQAWASQVGAVQVMFADSSSFFNANTAQDLAQLQRL